ncbi:MAG: hypothetical protein M9894_36695 [Planctomycetes bacterium]|nr:hypothetical protein [Planctomycetota bacterium]
MGDYTDFDEQQADRAGSSGFLKFCLICGCLLLLLMGAGAGVMYWQLKDMFVMDPVRVTAKVEAEILPGAKVPDGYSGMFAMRFPGGLMEFALIAPEGMQQQANQNTLPLMIMACTIPPGSSADEVKGQMQQAMQQQTGRAGGNMKVEAEEQRTITARGVEVTLQEHVGVADNGVKMKQLLVIVPQKPGSSQQVLLMFMGKEDIFDQAAVDAFLESLR